MRSLFFALLIGLSGIAVAYWQFQEAQRGKIESFLDPAERIQKTMIAMGQNIPSDLKMLDLAKIQVVNGNEFDFGRMSRHSERKHTFVLKNNGRASTQLEVVRSSCKCTIGELTKKELGPGEETEIVLTWRAESLQREFSQTATIKTDDPDQQEIQLVVKGLVENRVYLEPREYLFGEVSSSEPIERTALLFSDFDQPLEIKSLKWSDASSADRVQLSQTVRKIEPGEFPDQADAQFVAEIRVRMSPGMPTGPMRATVDIESNVGESNLVQLGFVGRIISQVRFIGGTNYNETTNVFEMGSVASSEGTVVKILLGVRVDGNIQPEISVANIQPSDVVKVRIGAGNPQNGQTIFPVELEVPKGAAPVSLRGTNRKDFAKILFRTNLEFSPEIPLYLRLEVEDR